MTTTSAVGGDVLCDVGGGAGLSPPGRRAAHRA